ncbi:clathrin light chain 2-like [Andrographis paniculata]|uniref:clathrin light chain 2-like n=1 Tax=Andrographis paniculata TaxID=175694 RepID=UPI0021E82B13|nr:clathrin light chain 2-like [Andrographis paniculata]
MSSDFARSYIDDSRRLRLSSQRFEPARFESFLDYYAESESKMEREFDHLSAYGGADDAPRASIEADFANGERSGHGPILLPPPEEGLALREWKRENAIRLEEKERREKELLKEIIDQADEYKAEYYKKWKLRCDNYRSVNREKEKLFLESTDKFHIEAGKNYWKAISELVPQEISTIEKKWRKDMVKKPSIVIIHGPKPGKPTDLSRMHQILVKLKHRSPDHLLASGSEPGKDDDTWDSTSAAPASLPGKPLATTFDSS